MSQSVPPLFTPRPSFGEATPPAIFPPVLGALGLGIAWRRAEDVFPVPAGVGDLILGALTLLFLFCLAAYGLKLRRRPAVVEEDLRVLPGRAGLSAAVLAVYVTAAGLAPISYWLAMLLLWAGFALHVGLVVLVVRAFLSGPPEQRAVTPVWHLQFVGFIVGAVTAAALGLTGLATVLLFVTGPMALGIWGVSAVQLKDRDVPPPLRPLLAIHLAPASLLATVALMTGRDALALVCILLASVILAALVLRLKWLLAAGFTPLWAAFTFPLAAYASALLALADVSQGGLFRVAGGLALVLATLSIPPILVKVMQAWAKGTLGAKTNAARA